MAATAVTESLAVLGLHEEELTEWRRYFAALGDTEMAGALERGFATGGYPGAVRAVAQLLEARSLVAEVPAVFAARWQMRAEDTDRALTWLERALVARDQNLPYINAAPLWDPLRGDPRFIGLLRRMNLEPP